MEADREAGRTFPEYRPLSAEGLHASRLRFEGGVPKLLVGLEEDAKELVLEAVDGPLRLVFDEGGVPKTVYANAGRAHRFRPRSTRSAERRWWVRVASFPADDRGGAEEALERWRARGLSARLETGGALFAVRGTVLDTRIREVLVGGYPSRSEADRLGARLFREEGRRNVVRPTLVRRPVGAIEVLDSGGTLLHVATDLVYAGTVVGGQLAWGERRYSEHLYVTLGPEGGLALVASVDAEALLRGVVPAEIFASAPRAALEAQAIVARGALLSQLGHRHFDAPYHLCDEQHCQVYKGAGVATASTDEAIRVTRGRVLVRPRARPFTPIELVASVYSASCGGYGEGNEVVWDEVPSASLRPRLDGPAEDPALAPFRSGISEKNLVAWLEGTPPAYCASATFSRPERFRWTRIVEREALEEVGRALGVGAPIHVEILGRGQGGRVTGVRVEGVDGSTEVLRELPVRRLFGNLYSGAFTLTEEHDEAGRLARIHFVGAGWGHGVGLCQMGAIGRAEAGHRVGEILEHYFSGATLERLYD